MKKAVKELFVSSASRVRLESSLGPSERPPRETRGGPRRDVRRLRFEPARAGVWRDCSCCGDDTDWAKSIDKFNDIAEDVVEDEGYPVVKVFDMWDKGDLKKETVDGTHATPENYHKWTVAVLQAAETQLKTGCLESESESESEDEEPVKTTPRPTPAAFHRVAHPWGLHCHFNVRGDMTSLSHSI